MNDSNSPHDCDLPFAELKRLVDEGIEQMRAGKVSAVNPLKILEEVELEFQSCTAAGLE